MVNLVIGSVHRCYTQDRIHPELASVAQLLGLKFFFEALSLEADGFEA